MTSKKYVCVWTTPKKLNDKPNCFIIGAVTSYTYLFFYISASTVPSICVQLQVLHSAKVSRALFHPVAHASKLNLSRFNCNSTIIIIKALAF